MIPFPPRDRLRQMDTRVVRPDPAKETEGDFSQFTNFMRRLVAVPHSEIKARMEAAKRSRAASASRAPASGAKSR